MKTAATRMAAMCGSEISDVEASPTVMAIPITASREPKIPRLVVASTPCRDDRKRVSKAP
jgi:hypothetical protein